MGSFRMWAVMLCVNFLVISVAQPCNGAKILSLAFISSKSHKITYDLLLEELIARGHELTVVTPVTTKVMPKAREIVTMDFEEGLKKMPNMFEIREKKGFINPLTHLEEIKTMCRKNYENPEVMKLLNEKFDLVFLPVPLFECSAGFVFKLNTSVVLFSPVSALTSVSNIMGSPAPPSFVPNVFTSYSDRMTFYERTINFLVENLVLGMFWYVWQPTMTALYRDALNDSSIPVPDDLIRKASLMLSNSHFSMGTKRPFLPDIMEVGGMHCRPGKPLPADLEAFANSTGPDGFIFFSFGSTVQVSHMPEKSRKELIRAFAKLKQKVLWKSEMEAKDLPGLPPNVKVSKWLPQQDVLGHKNIKAFVTHGGLGSVTEAVYHGVPLVAIPLFSDQYLNVQKAVAGGYAETIEFNDITEDYLVEVINRVATEKKYRDRIQELSRTFQDQPDKPLDRAVYWIEYVIRHKGAPQLRSASRDLYTFQYNSVDVIAVLSALSALILYLSFLLIRLVFRCTIGRCFSKKSNSSSKTTPAKKKN